MSMVCQNTQISNIILILDFRYSTIIIYQFFGIDILKLNIDQYYLLINYNKQQIVIC
jgi:hypothetical protein